MDGGSRLRDVLEVDTSDDDLVLNVSGTGDGAALEHGHLADLALSQEVTDLDSVSSLGLLVLIGDSQVDGEVVVDETHLVGVSLGDSDDHVLDVGHNSAHAGQLLLSSPPNLDLKATLTDLGDIQLQVLEALGQLSLGTSDSDDTGDNVDIHYRQSQQTSINQRKRQHSNEKEPTHGDRQARKQIRTLRQTCKPPHDSHAPPSGMTTVWLATRVFILNRAKRNKGTNDHQGQKHGLENAKPNPLLFLNSCTGQSAHSSQKRPLQCRRTSTWTERGSTNDHNPRRDENRELLQPHPTPLSNRTNSPHGHE